MHQDPADGDLYEDLERRALHDMPEQTPGEDVAPDLIGSLRGDAVADAKDMSLGGYIEEHDRVPAFEGSDGQPYTVDVDVEPIAAGLAADPAPDARPDPGPTAEVTGGTRSSGASFAAFLVFIRWAETGAGIMDHVESGDVAWGRTEDEARQAAMDLSLYEIKAELDAAIERRRQALEE
jgi:hypothetical protein